MVRRAGRTQDCSTAQAAQRLLHARSFLDVAELAADEKDPDIEYASVAASLAVLAGIAAADAACCQRLGKRSRSDDHRDAASLLAQIAPGGEVAADDLLRLLDLKDTAHYGLISVTGPALKRAMRRAESLVNFAEVVVRA